MGFVRVFSKPLEIQKFLQSLDEIDTELLKHFSAVQPEFKNHVRAAAVIGENSKVIIQLIKDGLDPKITAYLFLRVMLEDILLDGEHFGLQGELSPDGERYLALYNSVIRELRLLNWFSAAQADAYFNEIRVELEAAT